MIACTRQYFNMRICELFSKGLQKEITSAKTYQDIYYTINGVGVARHVKLFKRNKLFQETFLINEGIK